MLKIISLAFKCEIYTQILFEYNPKTKLNSQFVPERRVARRNLDNVFAVIALSLKNEKVDRYPKVHKYFCESVSVRYFSQSHKRAIICPRISLSDYLQGLETQLSHLS